MPLSASGSSSSALPGRWAQGLSAAASTSRALVQRRPFSSSPAHRVTKQRKAMFAWLQGPGAVFRDPLPGSTNYLSAYDPRGRLMRLRNPKGRSGGDAEAAATEADEEGETPVEASQEGPGGISEDANIAGSRPIPPERPLDLRPFPRNSSFRSQSVLSEEAKQAVFDDVTKKGMTIREASEKHGVDMARVGAVIRLKAVEAEWTATGKPLATAYSRAVLSMLPQTRRGRLHEPINDLPVHAATTPQIFWPASEARQFTRADAGAVFARGLLPADARIPHPEMVRAATYDPALPTNGTQRAEALRAEMRAADAEAEARAAAPAARRAAATTSVPAPRADFRFRDVRVDDRSTGRYARGVGARYGVPHQDRKKSQVKIPTRVE